MPNLDEPIYYDNVDLNTVNGLTITGLGTYRQPQNSVSNFEVALQNRSVSVTRNEQSKIINISGVITGSSRTTLEENIDDLNAIIKKINKQLNVPMRGSRYIFRDVTYQSLSVGDVAGGYAAVDIEFIASDPYSYSTSLSTALASTNVMSTPQTLVVGFLGNTDQAAIITIDITNVEPETSDKRITLTNQYTGEAMYVERTYTDGEQLIIDAYNRTVTVDGVAVDYSGLLPIVGIDCAAFTISNNFTSCDMDVKIEYYKRFI